MSLQYLPSLQPAEPLSGDQVATPVKSKEHPKLRISPCPKMAGFRDLKVGIPTPAGWIHGRGHPRRTPMETPGTDRVPSADIVPAASPCSVSEKLVPGPNVPEKCTEAHTMRYKSYTAVVCHIITQQHGARGSGVRREGGRERHTKVYKSL